MLVGSDVRRVAIVGGSRIPFARSHGAYARAGNAEMLTAALQGVVSRFGLDGVRLGEVAAGAVIKHSRDFNLARECVLGTTLEWNLRLCILNSMFDDSDTGGEDTGDHDHHHQ